MVEHNAEVISMLHCFPTREGSGLLHYSPTVQAQGLPARLDGIQAETYLHYATQDLADNSERGRINAVGNCKRAIHLAIDNALSAYGLLTQNMNLTFPAKLELLNAPSLLPISVLRRLNIHRNIVEHEYATPDVQTTTEAIDIARLLLLAIDGLREAVIYEVTATTTFEDCPYAVIRLLPTSGTLNYHELHAPDEFFDMRRGVRFLNHILRNRRGLVEGITVRSDPTYSVPLINSEIPRWAPVLAEFAETSLNLVTRKCTISDNSIGLHVTIPAERAEVEIMAMIIKQLDIGDRFFRFPTEMPSISLTDSSKEPDP